MKGLSEVGMAETLEEKYARFHHYMKKTMGYMHCPNIYDIKSWEEWKALDEKAKKKEKKR
jgi:hypothetical protein